jgi:DNA modification methylase
LTGVLTDVGWVQRVVVNQRTGHLVDGHLHAELARKQGAATPVPVVYVDLSQEEELAILATLDPLAGMAEADLDALACLVQDAHGLGEAMDATLDDIAAAEGLPTGGDAIADVPPQLDRAEELREKWQVVTGQLWQLGEHRLICGDCREPETWARLLAAAGVDKVALLLTDPPYGVERDEGFEGFEGFGGFGTPIARHQYGDDWDSERPAKETFYIAIGSAEKAVIFGGNFFADLLPKSTHWIVWDKLQTMPTFGDCELAWTNVPRKSVKKFTVQYNGLLGKEKDRFHPTQKPVALFSEILREYTEVGDVIMDCYAGSGTTIMAAHNEKRRGLGIEKLEKYVAVTLQRFMDATGITPELVNG